MRVRKCLYVSESLKGREKKILGRIKRGGSLLNIYVLAVPMDNGEQLEFYDSLMFLQPFFRKRESLIVGLAAGYEEAVQITMRIVEEVLEKTGDVNIRKYLLESGRE